MTRLPAETLELCSRRIVSRLSGHTFQYELSQLVLTGAQSPRIHITVSYVRSFDSQRLLTVGRADRCGKPLFADG